MTGLFHLHLWTSRTCFLETCDEESWTSTRKIREFAPTVLKSSKTTISSWKQPFTFFYYMLCCRTCRGFPPSWTVVTMPKRQKLSFQVWVHDVATLSAESTLTTSGGVFVDMVFKAFFKDLQGKMGRMSRYKKIKSCDPFYKGPRKDHASNRWVVWFWNPFFTS